VNFVSLLLALLFVFSIFWPNYTKTFSFHLLVLCNGVMNFNLKINDSVLILPNELFLMRSHSLWCSSLVLLYNINFLLCCLFSSYNISSSPFNHPAEANNCITNFLKFPPYVHVPIREHLTTSVALFR